MTTALLTSVFLPLAEGGEEEESTIQIGHHVERELFGITFNLDTIWTTALAAGAVLLLGFLARRALTRDTDDHVPTKIQLLWETIVKEVNTQVEDNLGRVHPYVTPLAISLFFFILFANWLELLPTALNDHVHLTPAPTADVNLTYAMALLVVVGVNIFAVQTHGIGGYLKGFLKPYPIMAPLTVLEELIKPFTLALRLFGNIFAGGIMLALIGQLPFYVQWLPSTIWQLFDMFIGLIQAFIFALLTILYFGMAAQGHGSHDDEAHPSPDATEAPANETQDEAQGALQPV